MTSKRKIDDVDFSDTDEEALVGTADLMELHHEIDELYFGDTEAQNVSSTKRYSCAQCGVVFTRKSNLTRHTISHKSTVRCQICGRQFRRKDNLKRHYRRVHGGNRSQLWDCNHCDQTFVNYSELVNHVTAVHPMNTYQRGGRMTASPKALDNEKERSYISHANTTPPSTTAPPKANSRTSNAETPRLTSTEGALNNNAQDETIYPNDHEKYDMLLFFANTRSQVDSFLRSRLYRHGIKWYLSVQVHLYRENTDGDVTATAEPHFRSRSFNTLNAETLDDHELNEAYQKMSQSLESYLRDSSGWIIKNVIHLKIHTIIYTPIAGSSYMPLPQSLKSGKSILNIRNRDQKCFLWSVLSSLYPVEDEPEKVSHYESHENELDMHDIDYPVSISKLNQFESQNPNISVNVFTMEENEIVPLKITKHNGRLHHVNLLFLKNQRGSHYYLITDLNRFLARTNSHNGKHYYCPYCLHGFTREPLLQDHIPYCCVQEAQKIMLPEMGDNFLQFTDFEKSLKTPYVIYADFETLNRKLDTCHPDPGQSSTHQSTLLTPCSFGYKVVCVDPKFTKPTVIYRGSDASEKLIECLLKERDQIENHLASKEPMRLTSDDKMNFKMTTECCICKQTFSPGEQKAKHHNHVTGTYIGASHMNCNLQCNQAEFIPVIFHGLRNFDAHILCQSVGKFKRDEIKCIPNNMERYVSFSLGTLRFIDSYQFLSSSLETLVKDLVSEGTEAFPHLHHEFPSLNQSRLLLRKGVYPYDYMDDESKFEQTKLPPIEAFYSNLKRETITDHDYEHAEKVFHTFQLRNLGDYHDLYLHSDVILLCDVFEHFRNVCLTQYDLDPCHFYTSPGLSWSALLKKTGVVLELMTDIDQILFIEKGIRGGISQISNRYKRANNPFVPNYDPTQTIGYLQYLDAVNLYGFAMSQHLPTGGFRFLQNQEISDFHIHSVLPNASKGYILEVSLSYPKELHDDHNDYPLAPEHKVVHNDQLSPYARRVLKKLHNKSENDELPPRANIEKLLTTLDDKQNYVLHYRNLQLYLQLGLRIKEIHRILEFDQSPWMKSYVDYNTNKRKQAKSEFEKNFYKLMNNSVFGKTMENVRKHRNVELCQRPRRLKKISAKPTYKTHKIFTRDLVAVEFNRVKVLLKKPIYVGMSILDLSKHLMYDFYYNHLKKLYQSKLQLQFTDTDSFLFYCETNNVFHDMKEHLHLYDTSGFPEDHELHSNVNKKTMGKFKSETNEKCISEFIGLRSKMYAIKYDDREEKKAKGIGKVSVDKDVMFDTYKKTLDEESQVVSDMNVIRSHSHQIFCETVHKTGLSAFDDKRFLLPDGVGSLAYGHYNAKL